MYDIIKLVLQYGVAFLMVYYVYRNSKNKNIRHRNLWIIFSLLFPPTAIFYFLYSTLLSKEVVLSEKQKIDIEIRKRAAEHRKQIVIERAAMEEAQKEEAIKNNVTLEELEQIKANRIAEKKKCLQELEEERRYQQEENAKKMRLNFPEENNSQK